MKKWYTLIIICLAQIFVSCDNSVTLNSLSSLIDTFNANTSQVQLANSIFPLVTGALMLAGGFLGLKIGWKKLLYIGLLVMAGAELAAFLSPNLIIFTWVARLGAGLGATLAIPAAIGLIPVTYKGKDMAIGFGALGAAVGLAAFVGPLGGGAIIVDSGWRIAFVILAGCFALLFFLSLKIKELDPEIIKTKFDIIGTVLFALGMFMVIISLNNMMNWEKAISIPMLIGGLAIIVIFILYELKLEKKRTPVLLPSVFIKQKEPRAGLIMTALIFFIQGGSSFALITYLQMVLGFNAFKTGLMFVLFALGAVLFSLGTPLILKNPNPRRICQLAIILAVATSGMAFFTLKLGSIDFFFYICIFVFGIANGLLSSQAGLIVTSIIPKNLGAQSGGIQGSMRNVGQVLGYAIIGIIMISSLTAGIKVSVAKDAQIPKNIESKIELIKEASFVNNVQLQQYLTKDNVSQAEQPVLISIDEKNSVDSLKISYLIYGILIAIFFIFTFQIPKSYKH